MTVKVVNSNFNGFLHKMGRTVKSIGVTVEEDFWLDSDLYPQSISLYANLICKVRSIVGNKKLYQIAANVKEGAFSQAQIYKGLGDNFKKAEQRLIQNDISSVMVGCRELTTEQINSSLCSHRMNQVICFSDPAVVESLFLQNENIFFDFGKLKDELVSKFSIIIELMDLSYDGNTLFFYGLPENKCLGEIEDFIRKNI